MPLLRNADWQEPCTSIRSTPGLFAWMPPLGACASSAGFIRCWVPVRLFPGIPKTRSTVLACPQRGPEKNSASATLIERFFGRVFLFFHLQRPPLCGWSEIASQVALTYAASVIVGLAARACWSSRSHPFSQTCPSSSVGGGVRGVKRPRRDEKAHPDRQAAAGDQGYLRSLHRSLFYHRHRVSYLSPLRAKALSRPGRESRH